MLFDSVEFVEIIPTTQQSAQSFYCFIVYLLFIVRIIQSFYPLYSLGIYNLSVYTVGYKNKVDSSSMFGSNSKMVGEEVSRVDELYRNTADMKQISMQCEKQKVDYV